MSSTFIVLQVADKKKKSKKRPSSAKNHYTHHIDSKDTTPRTKSSFSDYSNRNGEVEVTTTIRTKGSKINVRPPSAPSGTSGHKVSLNVLRDMKKLQTTLRKDDLKWE